MSKDLIPLVTSGMAILVSLFSLFYTAKDRRSAEVRLAQRNSLEKVIVELGNELYSVVAMSKRMGLATDNTQFIENKKTATESSRRVDHLRRDSRYFLWGLNDGIHTLSMVPKYVEFLRGDNDSVEAIVKIATELREALDLAIKHCYQSGMAPSKRSIRKVADKMEKVKAYYENEKAGQRQDSA